MKKTAILLITFMFAFQGVVKKPLLLQRDTTNRISFLAPHSYVQGGLQQWPIHKVAEKFFEEANLVTPVDNASKGVILRSLTSNEWEEKLEGLKSLLRVSIKLQEKGVELREFRDKFIEETILLLRPEKIRWQVIRLNLRPNGDQNQFQIFQKEEIKKILLAASDVANQIQEDRYTKELALHLIASEWKKTGFHEQDFPNFHSAYLKNVEAFYNKFYSYDFTPNPGLNLVKTFLAELGVLVYFAAYY